MKKITRHRIQSNSLDGLKEFYVNCLGMKEKAFKNGLSFQFQSNGCELVFVETICQSYTASPTDFYWKTGITVKNLDAAVGFLRNLGLAVADPVQFQDIGYLAHLKDPQGHVIELLQQGFEGNEKSIGSNHPLGSGATVAHISLRVADIERSGLYLTDQLDMRLMSVQPVEGRGFTLYFYGWSKEVLPNLDIRAIENREWLWRRPYTLLELQHFHQPVALNVKNDGEAGFEGFSYGDNIDETEIALFLADLIELS